MSLHHFAQGAHPRHHLRPSRGSCVETGAHFDFKTAAGFGVATNALLLVAAEADQ